MNRTRYYTLCAGIMLSLFGQEQGFAQNAQTTVNLNDLSAFKQPGKSWQIVGDVHADRDKDNSIRVDKGAGVLLNLADDKKAGQDLYFNLQHGDIDLEMDYMLARSANSGIYLQGRYEVQLADSWRKTNPTAADNGGIYERWNESSKQGYDGHSPRQNVSRAPGLWQHIKLAFQAPRFDASGKKTDNARLLYLELNGVRVQENIELTGPTQGAVGNDEVAIAPLRFQGDHGTIAFRNIKYKLYDTPRQGLWAGSNDYDPVDPIPVNVIGTNTLMRCFIDLWGGQRVTHAINVGNNQQVHYTYDADNGMIVQVWRGGFLDATPMWHHRGDGSSRATGAVLQFGKAMPALKKLGSAQAAWTADTTGSGYRFKGYSLNKDKQPTFKYNMYGTAITDVTSVVPGGNGLQRTIELGQPIDGLYFRVASASNIEDQGNGWYLLNDKSYYLHIDDAASKPLIRDSEGKKEMLIPVGKKISYSLIF